MSIHKRPERPGPDGRPQWEVKWREGGRQRARLFARQKDAEAFELDVKRRKQLGPLAGTVMISRVTLAEFMREEWWPRYAIPNLKPSTRQRYLEVWGAYLLPTLGDYELREITPLLVEDLRQQLNARGLGSASVRKALLLLSGIMRRAVVRGLLPANPVALVDLPKAPAPRRPEPLAPATVERIRERLRRRDATLVSVLAYAGLRPGEALGAHWADLGERTLYVPARKTSRERHVDLVSPLAKDLAEWRLACGRPEERELIFPATAARNSGGEAIWENWVKRVYQPAARACGVTGDMRAYRLRGSFVSLLLWSGVDLVDVSDQSGHSVATLARHYAGVIRELKGQPKVPAGEAIRQARERLRPLRAANPGS